MINVADNSSFSPRVSPRPAYPSFTAVAPRAGWNYFRDMAIGVALVALAAGPYEALRSSLEGSFGVSDRAFYALTIVAAHSGSFLLFNGGVALGEALGWVQQFKIYRKPAEVPEPSLFKKLYFEAAINHCVTSPLTSYGLYFLARNLGMPLASEQLPPLFDVAKLMFFAHAFNDIGFYCTHRLLHSKALYKTFHKQHHTFRGSVGAAAEFAHPVEVLLSNQIPTLGLLLAIGAHPLLQATWLVLRLTQTYEVHSGYAFDSTLAGSVGLAACGAAFHDHHHSANMGNFGAEHMDWLFGTMDHWVRDGGEEGYLAKRRADAAKSADKSQ